ncbi:MAG: insulinase family protein [Bacteroidetes bacterium]|nr:insulinase family protein [Bacteroidota bacterium]
MDTFVQQTTQPIKTKMKAIKNTLVLCVLNHCFFAQTQNIKLNIKEYKLDNGFTVILNEDKTQPKVFGGVSVRAGSKNDPADATGLAHYMEHLLFKGTETLGTKDYAKEKPFLDSIYYYYDKMAGTTDEKERAAIRQRINANSIEAGKYGMPNEFDKMLRSIGSEGVNAFTSNDITFYHNTFPPAQIERWLDVYAHRFQKPVFRSFQSELEVVYEEKNRGMDMFFVPLIEKVNSLIYKHHPYGTQTTIGTVAHLKNPSLTKMYQFFNTYYVANNMALVLSGNFDTDEIMPIIKEKFGKLRTGTVPEFPQYKEDDFKEREFYQVRMSPIKLGVLAYRTVPAGHADEVTLNVVNALLSNSSQTGLIDELSAEGKLMAAGLFPSTNKDYGATVLFFVPKIIGQPLENAEGLVLTCIDQIKKGAFDETLLTAIKNSLLIENQKELENISTRAVLLGQLFANGQTSDVILKQITQLQNITKQMVVDAANKYYNKNVLTLYSKTGFPKKEKLKKPGFKPVLANQSAESEYAAYFKTIPEKKITPHFLDFKADVSDQKIYEKHRLIAAKNPENNLFSLDISYQTNWFDDAAIETAVKAMNYVETPSLKNIEIKKKLQQLGVTVGYETTDEEVTISLSGLENNLEPALQMLETIFKEGRFNDKTILKIVEDEKGEKKLNMNSPEYKGQLLYNYVLFGANSPFLNKISGKELKNKKPQELFEVFKKSTQYNAEIKFVGNTAPEQLKSWIEARGLVAKEPLQQKKDPIDERHEVKENAVYVLPDSKSLQCQIHSLITSAAVDNTEKYKMDAFNDYFGNSFSGLVLQEIREYRSLAYSAGAKYKRADKPNAFSFLRGYMGVQADKTNEAIGVYDSLVKFIPSKPERLESIKSNLINLASSSYPEFRKIPETYLAETKLGYTQSPWIDDLPKYKNLAFEDIMRFYKDHIQGRTQALIIVGNTSRFSLKALEKYGKIIKVTKKMILKD